jgi:hypothetical protein
MFFRIQQTGISIVCNIMQGTWRDIEKRHGAWLLVQVCLLRGLLRLAYGQASRIFLIVVSLLRIRCKYNKVCFTVYGTTQFLRANF